MNSCGSQLLALSSSGQVQVCDERGTHMMSKSRRGTPTPTPTIISTVEHIIMDLVMFFVV